MKTPAILFVCLALTEFVQQAPEKKGIEWTPWIYVETRGGVELHWRRYPDPANPKVQFGLKNGNEHEVTVHFVEQSYLYADGSFEPRKKTQLNVPALSNRGARPDVLKRLPKTWNLRWEVRRKKTPVESVSASTTKTPQEDDEARP